MVAQTSPVLWTSALKLPSSPKLIGTPSRKWNAVLDVFERERVLREVDRIRDATNAEVEVSAATARARKRHSDTRLPSSHRPVIPRRPRAS